MDRSFSFLTLDSALCSTISNPDSNESGLSLEETCDNMQSLARIWHCATTCNHLSPLITEKAQANKFLAKSCFSKAPSALILFTRAWIFLCMSPVSSGIL